VRNQQRSATIYKGGGRRGHRERSEVPSHLVPACWSLVSSLVLSARVLHRTNSARRRYVRKISRFTPPQVCRGQPGGCISLVFSLIFTSAWCTARARSAFHYIWYYEPSLAWLCAIFCKLLPLAVVFGGRASSCNVRIEPAACHSQGIISTL
jgi:hypothetical protein